MFNFYTAFKGMAMGIAEVIPGVSGGTIALITGIYEKLIRTIRKIDLSLVATYKAKGINGISEELDIPFLMTLLAGMFIGVVIGVFGVSYLLEEYPELLWGFFFGLIIASSIYVGRQVEKWDLTNIGVFVLGVIVAFGITMISPSEGNASFFYVFISGCIAICALILPGISGSFILLLMGMYTIVIPAIKSLLSNQDIQSLLIVSVFGIGCLVGLLTFSRVMNYLFNNYKNITLALLSGFMIGSLNKIWPWRNVTEILEKETFTSQIINNLSDLQAYSEYKVLGESNVLPPEYWMGSPKVFSVIISGLIGFGIIFLFERFDQKISP